MSKDAMIDGSLLSPILPSAPSDEAMFREEMHQMMISLGSRLERLEDIANMSLPLPAKKSRLERHSIFPTDPYWGILGGLYNDHCRCHRFYQFGMFRVRTTGGSDVSKDAKILCHL